MAKEKKQHVFVVTSWMDLEEDGNSTSVDYVCSTKAIANKKAKELDEELQEQLEGQDIPYEIEITKKELV